MSAVQCCFAWTVRKSYTYGITMNVKNMKGCFSKTALVFGLISCMLCQKRRTYISSVLNEKICLNTLCFFSSLYKWSVRPKLCLEYEEVKQGRKLPSERQHISVEGPSGKIRKKGTHEMIVITEHPLETLSSDSTLLDIS